MHFDEFEDVYFKYDNSFNTLHSKNTPQKEFLVPNIKIFVFAHYFHFNELEGVDFKYDKTFSKLHPKKNLALQQIRGC